MNNKKFFNLPIELQQKVFTYFGSEHHQILMSVCKTWNIIVSDIRKIKNLPAIRCAQIFHICTDLFRSLNIKNLLPINVVGTEIIQNI